MLPTLGVFPLLIFDSDSTLGWLFGRPPSPLSLVVFAMSVDMFFFFFFFKVPPCLFF